VKSRYPVFRKGPNGERLCRGCGAPVPKGRKTWCSSECYETHCPDMVIAAMRRRDNGVCAHCGVNAEALQASAWRMINRACHVPWWDRGNQALWLSAGDRIRAAIRKAGWPSLHRNWWEADHIREFSEGGLTVLANMQTLCVRCHKRKTVAWRKLRAKRVGNEHGNTVAVSTKT
jgi:5-methylcytosine-specific restriction enzyme A